MSTIASEGLILYQGSSDGGYFALGSKHDCVIVKLHFYEKTFCFLVKDGRVHVDLSFGGAQATLVTENMRINDGFKHSFVLIIESNLVCKF